MVYSVSVGVKMSTLLVLPAIGAMLLQAVGRDKAMHQAMIMAQVQVVSVDSHAFSLSADMCARSFSLRLRLCSNIPGTI